VLEASLDLITYQRKEEIKALVDSGAMDNFIDFHTVNKLKLETQKIPNPRRVLNMDETQNQGGLIEHSVHLYIERGGQQIWTQFFVTNLGKDCIILGYPWLEAFNLEINWKEGKILGPQTKLKTTGIVAQEHIEQAYKIRQMAMEVRKLTIAQKMAEAFQNTDKPKTNTPIPPEYCRHKVSSE
jgi:Retroviral aspartyl protease